LDASLAKWTPIIYFEPIKYTLLMINMQFIAR